MPEIRRTRENRNRTKNRAVDSFHKGIDGTAFCIKRIEKEKGRDAYGD